MMNLIIIGGVFIYFCSKIGGAIGGSINDNLKEKSSQEPNVTIHNHYHTTENHLHITEDQANKLSNK